MSATRKILFVDRDGTLLAEPVDYPSDGVGRIGLLPHLIPSLLKLRDAGYELVMVSNQDGLGGPGYPRQAFDGPQQQLVELLESQGLRFAAIHVDTHRAAEHAPTRKPGIGMVLDYLRSGTLDFGASAMVGDRETDMQFARNMGIRGFRLGENEYDWPAIAHLLADGPRMAQVERATQETRVRVRVDLDREAAAEVATGIGFFDHMLEQLGRHGGFALTLSCAGDTHVDEHHTVEDSALALGQALSDALGDKRGIARYGFVLPMDESRAEALLDLSGRPHFVFEGRFPREQVGELPTELVPHFFRSLAEALRANLHLRVSGENAHHMVEACFKAVARALRQAIRREGAVIPSTKGSL